MNINIEILKTTIKDLESFYHQTNNLNDSEKTELKAIIDRFKSLGDHPNITEIVQVVMLLFKLIAEGSDLIKHLI